MMDDNTLAVAAFLLVLSLGLLAVDWASHEEGDGNE